MKKPWGLAFGVLAMTLSSPAWADRDTAQYTSLTVFGDSLVDAGNYYIETGGVSPTPDLPYPDPALGYFGGRLTNGYLYPDLLSQDLFGGPTAPALAGGSNFAFAGARIVDTGDPVPDLAAQLGMFQLSGQAVDANGLYILNFGANDVFGALGVFGPDGAIGSFPDTTSYFQAAAEQYAAGVQALNDLGVRNILMTDFPLAGHPYTIEANGYLAAALAGLTLDADTDLLVYSLSDFNQRVLTDPAAFGLPPLRIDTNCIAENAQATGCRGIFSFDGVHPTAAVQAAGYRDMVDRFGLTASVPEPATWAMMIVGFGMVGGALRRRQARRVRFDFASGPTMPGLRPV
jgi:phospholipase/lecithinase/hemolysin